MGRPKDPKTRTQILLQAEHLLHLRGYHHTSMDEIARSCSMTKANLFHHFDSKEDLVLAVLDDKMSDYRKLRIDPLCAEGDPGEAVSRMFEDCAKFYTGNGCKAGCFAGNMALEMSDLNEEFRRRVGKFFLDWTEGMARCLARARQAGTFSPSLDPRAVAETILSMYEGAIMLARTHRDASVLGRVGKIARGILEQHRNPEKRRKITMGPKTPCGC